MAGACSNVLPGVTGLPCDQTPRISVQYLQSWQSHHRREVMENVGDGIWYRLSICEGGQPCTLQERNRAECGRGMERERERQTEKMRAFSVTLVGWCSRHSDSCRHAHDMTMIRAGRRGG